MNAVIAVASLLILVDSKSPVAETLPHFHRSPWFEEQTYESWIEAGVRAIVNAPAKLNPSLPTQLIIYATPNGNTVEQTLGCAKAVGLDWRFDIQHIAAQVRYLREHNPHVNIVLACIEADGLSWPNWRKRYLDHSSRVRRILEKLKDLCGQPASIVLTGHSGGGSFVTMVLNAHEEIPAEIELIAYLDSNYSYSDSDRHGDKLLAWINTSATCRLAVIAYDDRHIELNGKRVVGPDGGTFRATQRMIQRIKKDIDVNEAAADDFVYYSGLQNRIQCFVHTNNTNKILHTVLVGEMNGLIAVMQNSAPAGPRRYAKRIQPAPGIPPRPDDAIGGRAFAEKIANFSPGLREEAIVRELQAGNTPEFLRRFVKMTARSVDAAGRTHVVTYEVIPDYLAVGSDADFVRMPMTPMTAQRIADAWGCALPTRKMVNDIYSQATVKLEPKPLTEGRESVATFAHHNALIEQQRSANTLGKLVAGIKKDIIVTNRLDEKPHRVAIFGWHKLDGVAIQPLNVSHVNTYVDYSHGVRLIRRTVAIDDKPMDMRHVMYSTDWCSLVSDEGSILRPSY